MTDQNRAARELARQASTGRTTMAVTDLQRVAQHVKSDRSAPADVVNAACRLLDQQDTTRQELERLRAELAEAREKHQAEIASLQRLADRFREQDDRRYAAIVVERDALKTAIQHFAAEAHRRKWVYEGTPAFSELHRLGNELLAALDAPESPGDAEEATDG